MATEETGHQELEKTLYAYHAEMCKVFSHPTRLEIINTLRQQELSVGELARQLGIGMSTLSQHLTMMKDRRILMSRKEGNAVHYRLSNPKILQAFDMIRDILFEQLERNQLLLRERP